MRRLLALPQPHPQQYTIHPRISDAKMPSLNMSSLGGVHSLTKSSNCVICAPAWNLFSQRQAIDELLAFRTQNAKKAVHSFCPLGGVGGTADSPGVPRRLWQRLALAAGVTAGEKWAEVAKAKLVALAQQLTVCEFEVGSRSRYTKNKSKTKRR